MLYEGKDPVTGLGFRETQGRKLSETLFILTTSHVLAYPLSGAKGVVATVIDDLGAGVGCSAMVETREGARMVVAREEAVYVYGGEGREGCYAYEGAFSRFCVSPLLTLRQGPNRASRPSLQLSPPRHPQPLDQLTSPSSPLPSSHPPPRPRRRSGTTHATYPPHPPELQARTSRK